MRSKNRRKRNKRRSLDEANKEGEDEDEDEDGKMCGRHGRTSGWIPQTVPGVLSSLAILRITKSFHLFASVEGFVASFCLSLGVLRTGGIIAIAEAIMLSKMPPGLV